MESLQDSTQEKGPDIFSVSNSRRVLTQLRKFTDPQTSTSFLLGADSMYGSNTMDGKFKVFSLAQEPLSETFFVEVPYGVQSIEHVAIDSGAQEFILTGLDDGTVQVFDYTKHKGKPSIQRPVFKVQKSQEEPVENRAADLDHPYDNFQESLYEHGATVTSIEKNFKDQTIFATAGRDQKAFIWKLSGEGGKEDVELVTEIGR